MTSRRSPRLRRVIKWTLGVLAVLVPLIVFVVLPYLLARFITSRGTRPRDLALSATPADSGLEYEDVSFEARDGVRLSGWYLSEGHRDVSVICAHGLFRSRREILDRAVLLAKHGFDVLALDLRNHGESGGEQTTLGYKERLDLEAAGRYVEKRAPGNTVVLYGVSMGAAAALLAAAESPGVAAVVADSPFLSVENTVVHHLKLIFGLPRFPFGDILLYFLERRGSFQREDFDVEKAVRQMGERPVLIIAGARDRRMPVAKQRQLFEASAGSLSRFVVIEDAGHGAAYRADPQKYEELLLDFLTDAVPSGASSAVDKRESARSRPSGYRGKNEVAADLVHAAARHRPAGDIAVVGEMIQEHVSNEIVFLEKKISLNERSGVGLGVPVLQVDPDHGLERSSLTRWGCTVGLGVDPK